MVRYIIPSSIYGILTRFKRKVLVNNFKRIYPNLIVFDRPISKLYSQENQDYIIHNNFFENKDNGVYCDVGGNHPLNINNTRYFEEKGWSGYVFEPLPKMKPLWEKHRTAKFFDVAASDINGVAFFTIVSDANKFGDMLSFINNTRDVAYVGEQEKIEVKTRRLDEIFAEEKITHIDYMSIDVEGHEYNVICGINFNEVTINVLTIENNSGNHNLFGDPKIREYMLSNGYEFWGRILGLDDIYVKDNFLKNISDGNYSG